MKLTLFDAAQSVREAVSVVNPETGEIAESAYQNSREIFDLKAGACVAYAMDEATQIKAAGEMLKAMQSQLKAREARLDRFRAYMLDCMKSAGVHQIAADGLARAVLYPDRDESVEIDEGATFAPELCSDPKPPAPSLTKIKAAILAGQPIAGARIVRRDRLTIK